MKVALALTVVNVALLVLFGYVLIGCRATSAPFRLFDNTGLLNYIGYLYNGSCKVNRPWTIFLVCSTLLAAGLSIWELSRGDSQSKSTRDWTLVGTSLTMLPAAVVLLPTILLICYFIVLMVLSDHNSGSMQLALDLGR